MDYDIILDAITSHMELLSSLQGWMLVTAVATIYMAVSRGQELDLKIIKATRHNAAILVVALYLVIMAAILVIMIRLYGLLELLPSEKVGSAFTVIATHSWLLNPFAYFGDSFLYRLAAWASLVGLLIVWAIVLASTSVIRGSFQRLEITFGVSFVTISILTLAAVQQVYFLLVTKTAANNPGLSSTLESLRSTRLTIIQWGGVAAMIAALAAVALIDKRRPEEDKVVRKAQAKSAPNPGPSADR